jgi:hypothetical protein
VYEYRPLGEDVMTKRHAAVVASFALVVSCKGELVAPPNAVLGRFGGHGVELVATANAVRVQWVCNFAQFSRPLVPATDGAFALSPTLIPLGNHGGNAAVAIRGTVSGSQIAFEAVWLTAAGEVSTSHFSVLANAPADFTDFACSADGP